MKRYNYPVSPELIEAFFAWTLRHLGWKLQHDDTTLSKRLYRLCSKMGYSELNECTEFWSNLGADKRAIQAVAREFGIGESYFFRDASFFRQLEFEILPELIANDSRRLHVWSVGCSSGEELYSVAMMLYRMIPDVREWDLCLLGTDVNTELLDKARRGVFSKWSFREIPDSYSSHYFKSVSNGFEILPAIQDMVHFEYHNLVSNLPPPHPYSASGFDLILLRNVLIYLDEEHIQQAVSYLCTQLNEGGRLATTAAEYTPDWFERIPEMEKTSAPMIRREDGKSDWFSVKASFDGEKPKNDEPISAVSQNDTRKHDDSKQATYQKQVSEEPGMRTCHLHYVEALRYLDNGATDAAKNALRQSLYLENGCIEAHIAMGNILAKEGDPAAAVRHLQFAKLLLSQKDPHEKLEYSDGITAGDLLNLIGTIISKDDT